MTLENYYNNLISQHRERRDRLKRLEESLNENGLSETVRAEKRSQHATKETEFLRLEKEFAADILWELQCRAIFSFAPLELFIFPD